MGQTIVVAIDLFKGSSLVYAHALSLGALEPDSVVHVVHVAEPNVANVSPSAIDAPELTGYDPKRLETFCDKHRVEYLKRATSPDRVPRVAFHEVSGDPAVEIVKQAAAVEADLIVLGTHGRTGIKRLLLGSVAENVVRTASCPVLVVREKSYTKA
jgi:nucleotide-binding universal stress UspA family protein